jgi:Txe/YoeB family toxin of Txe-Axe toxin-antitoxin module
MEIKYSENALYNLRKMDNVLKKLFLAHVEKLSKKPIKKHLRFGLPFFVEKVTKQARIVYNLEENVVYILRCFESRKEYERWYKRF